jgi:peptide/nickel transport system permease protein
MSAYVVRRLGQALVTLAVASVVIFALARVLPGDPVRVMLGEAATAEAVANLREEMGLDRPLVVQYLDWLWGALRFDLGDSIAYNRPVGETILSWFPPTLALLVGSMLVGTLLGIGLGAVAGLRPKGLADTAITAFGSIVIGTPSFWIGIMAILVFSLLLGWLPPGGWVPPDRDVGLMLRSLVLPTLTLGVILAASLSRFARSSVIESMSAPYIMTARSKGLSESRIVLAHGLRNALVPVITVLGIEFANVLAGVVVIEIVFAIPGWGRLSLGAINARDFPLIQAILLLAVAVFVLVNLVTDLLYGVADPRIRVK